MRKPITISISPDVRATLVEHRTYGFKSMSDMVDGAVRDYVGDSRLQEQIDELKDTQRVLAEQVLELRLPRGSRRE